MTRYTYDESGRLVSSTPEAEWDQEQQALMIALQAYEDATCSGCGGYLPETTAIEADDGYVVPDPTRCHRCTAIAQKADQYREAQQPHALLYLPQRKR